MIGQTISHYRILDKLGAGGMGVVYKAEDLKLKRIVAIKFLPPELTRDTTAKTRFVHEAQAAAALNHSNIATVHEIDEAVGHTFIVMEYVEGQSLHQCLAGGPVSISEALRIAIQVSRGLARAHSQGMVHRDIKPGNILLTAEGDAKIADFGLAKLGEQTRLTRTGTTIGTATYMSPEQAQGEEVDQRTDIWALGVLMYEMISGQLPFRGASEQAVIYSILHNDPTPLTSINEEVSIALEKLVEKSLAKDPLKRYQTAEELLSDLEEQQELLMAGLASRRMLALRRFQRNKPAFYGSLAIIIAFVAIGISLLLYQKSMAIDSIAVLPVKNVSGDPEQEWFAEGVMDAIINELGRVKSLRVISRTSMMMYKEESKAVPEIARELGVDAVVEASVAKSGDQVRVTAQLIRARPERQLWAESYNRDLQDVLTLYGEVAQEIASEVKAEITAQEEEYLATPRTIDPEAYQAYLKGRYHVNKWDQQGIQKGLEYFQEAIEIDPTCAVAYAGLARGYYWAGNMGYQEASEAAARAKAAAERAIELDDALAQGHEALARVLFQYYWNWEGADHEFRRAIELNPNLFEARESYGFFLACMGRGEEAITHARRAVELDPLMPTVRLMLGWTLLYSGRPAEAIEQYQQLLELDPDFIWARAQLGWAYYANGMLEEACAECRQALANAPEDEAVGGGCGGVMGLSGCQEEAREVLERMEARSEQQYVDPYQLAILRDGLGDINRAIEYLEQAFADGSGGLCILKVELLSDQLRADPRFQDIMRRMNFPAD